MLHLIDGHSGSMDPLNFFFESSTMGTILVPVVYFLANLAPFYYRKNRPEEFTAVKHVVLPVLVMIAIGVPVYYLCKPGQAAPYDWFPFAALAIVVVGAVYGFWLNRLTRRWPTGSGRSSPTSNRRVARERPARVPAARRALSLRL